MRLYIKQKSVSFKDRFHIYDEKQNGVFHVVREYFALGAKAHIQEIDSRKDIYLIKSRKVFSNFLAEIFHDGEKCASVIRKSIFNRRHLSVTSNIGELEIKGNFMNRDYEITRNGQFFGSMHRKLASLGDSYEINVPDEEYTGFMCALVITIDLNIRHH